MKITQQMIDETVGMPSRTAAAFITEKYGVYVGKSTINDARSRMKEAPLMPQEPDYVEAIPLRVLALDIESTPNLAHVWSLWGEQHINPMTQLQVAQEMMCFGAQWLGEDEVIFKSTFHHGRAEMVSTIYDLIDEADAIMGWNSRRYDTKHLNREFLLSGFTPPSPSADLDLMTVVKGNFNFPSNKLDYVAQTLGVGRKVEHEGHELWVKCMAGDPDAWERMREYQIQDVRLLFPLYEILKPWIKSHPNVALFNGQAKGCPNCGSGDLVRRNYYHTATGRFPLYQCAECGKWSRDSKRTSSTSMRAVS